MPPAGKRYIVVGPKDLPGASRSPDIYDVMHWRSGSRSLPPLPVHMQLPNYLSAVYAFERFQKFFASYPTWRISPRTLVDRFVNSAGFREVAEELERQGGLIWSVRYGAKPGIYTDTLEALISVDLAGRSKSGEVWQQAYTFRSFCDAVVCQMLNDYPTAAIHDYNPRDRANEAAALRATLLEAAEEVSVKAKSPEPPDNDEERQPTPPPERQPTPLPERQPMPPPEPASAPSTLRRSQPAYPYAGGSFNMFFSPNVAVRVNSPGISAPDRSSPGPSTPSRGSQAREALTRGRRTLLAEEFTMEQVLSIEALLMTSPSAENFAEEVCSEFGMKKLQALDVWDTYKGR